MYTQCPDCNAAFLVTADDLKRAAGKVRCGGCGNAFDALKYLSESLPETHRGSATEITLPELKPASPETKTLLPESIAANESIALLQTLDELAGSDIRIEDTGIEWRVLDEVALAELPTEDSGGNDAPMVAEIRYDDNSPLPESFPENEEAPETPREPVQEAIPDEQDEPVDGDDEFTETVGWDEIIDEFDELATSNIQKVQLDDEQLLLDDDEVETDEAVGESNIAPEPPEDSAGDAANDIEPVLDSNLAAEDDIELVLDSNLAAENDAEPESRSDVDADSDTDTDADADADTDTDTDTDTEFDPDSSPSQWQLLDEDDDQDEPLPTLTEPLKPEADPVEEHLVADGGDGLFTDEDIGIESIVMEGETVRYALDDMEAAAIQHAIRSDPDFAATYAGSIPHPRSTTRRVGTVVVALLLLLVLAAQVVHQERQSLAKIPAVNNLIGPLYRALGKPLAPAWDVTGWSFEATTGNADGGDQQLSIYSRIANRSNEALPYPLIGISLTDRFEEIIGNRMLEPADYLANSLNPRKMVAPGEAFDAFITITSPSAMASGYKLDVCYRLPDRRLRCAIGDFK